MCSIWKPLSSCNPLNLGGVLGCLVALVVVEEFPATGHSQHSILVSLYPSNLGYCYPGNAITMLQSFVSVAHCGSCTHDLLPAKQKRQIN